jgi:hypothetical protein
MLSAFRPKSTSPKTIAEAPPSFYAVESDNPLFDTNRGVNWCKEGKVGIQKNLKEFLEATELPEYDNIIESAKKRHTEENFLFLREVNEFKKDPNFKKAKEIYEKFIPENSVQQANLDAKHRTDIENAINKEEIFPELFDEAALEIIGLVYNDFLIGYCKKSKSFGKISKKRKGSRRKGSRRKGSRRKARGISKKGRPRRSRRSRRSRR